MHIFEDGELVTAANLNTALAEADDQLTAKVNGILSPFQVPGWDITGFPPGNTTPAAPPIIKTGTCTYFSSISYGNGYAPEVKFSTPFPNGILGFFIMPLTATTNGQQPQPPQRPYTVDQFSKDSFRAFIPGESSQALHAFSWIAIGY